MQYTLERHMLRHLPFACKYFYLAKSRRRTSVYCHGAEFVVRYGIRHLLMLTKGLPVPQSTEQAQSQSPWLAQSSTGLDNQCATFSPTRISAAPATHVAEEVMDQLFPASSQRKCHAHERGASERYKSSSIVAVPSAAYFYLEQVRKGPFYTTPLH